MRSLYESILRKTGVGLPANIKKLEELKGQHHFWGDPDSHSDVEIDITSRKWTKIVFDDEDANYWKEVTAWFCPESEWVIYKIGDEGFAAMAPAKNKMELKDFAHFFKACLNGATIPEFIEVETDLDK